MVLYSRWIVYRVNWCTYQLFSRSWQSSALALVVLVLDDQAFSSILWGPLIGEMQPSRANFVQYSVMVRVQTAWCYLAYSICGTEWCIDFVLTSTSNSCAPVSWGAPPKSPPNISSNWSPAGIYNFMQWQSNLSRPLLWGEKWSQQQVIHVVFNVGLSR